jgi:hypothetical protein
VLSDEDTPSHGETQRERDQQEYDRERETDCRERIRTVLAEPERIREVVCCLKEVRDDDRQREVEQRPRDATCGQFEFLAAFE